MSRWIRRLSVGLGVVALLATGMVPASALVQTLTATASSTVLSTPGPVTVSGVFASASPGGVTVAVQALGTNNQGVNRFALSATAVTAADGAYSVPITLGVAGDWTISVQATQTTTLVQQLKVHVDGRSAWLNAAVASTYPYINHPFVVKGTIGYTTGAWPGGVVHIVRHLGGVNTALGDATSGIDGQFSFFDTVAAVSVPSYTLSWDGDAAHDPVSIIRSVTVRAVPITAQAHLTGTPTSPLQDLTITGSLIYADGSPVTAAAKLILYRYWVSPNGSLLSSGAIPPFSSAADGTFTVTDRPGAGSWQYVIAPPNLWNNTFTVAILTTEVPFVDGQVTVSLGAGQRPTWNSMSTYTGTLRYADGSPVTVPETVWGTMTGACGGTTSSTATTAADGTYSMAILPACPGRSTLTVTTIQVNSHRAARASIDVAVAKATPTITFGASDSIHGNLTTLIAGSGTAKFDGSVAYGLGASTLNFFAQPRLGAKRKIGTITLKDGWFASGNVFYDFPKTAVISVEFSGDDALNPGTASEAFTVRPSLALSAPGHRVKGTSWTFKHTVAPKLVGSCRPAQPGKALTLVVQKKVKGVWKAFRRVTATEGQPGNAAFGAFPGSHPAKTVFRAKVIWAGDADLLAGQTGWTTIRFT